MDSPTSELSEINVCALYVLFLILSLHTVYVHPTGVPLQSWTIDDVSDFMTFLGYEVYIDRFLENEVDGRALSLIKDYHLLMVLQLRLGPALKICQQINAIKAIDDLSDTE